MQLIDDIEEAVAVNGESFRGPLLREAWPRIKAALLAAEEAMGRLPHAPKKEDCHACEIIARWDAATDSDSESVARFRAATQGPDAAAIGRAS